MRASDQTTIVFPSLSVSIMASHCPVLAFPLAPLPSISVACKNDSLGADEMEMVQL